MALHSKVLITGYDGFTGRHLSKLLKINKYDCVGIQSDITNLKSLKKEIASIEPDYVIHLAGISFTEEKNSSLIYQVNTIGTINLLDAILSLQKIPKKIILASSASVYGNNNKIVLNEKDILNPVSHYGCSKLSMENLACNYFNKLPIIITRPFNYSGIGHNEKFLIPKIIHAFKSKKKSIELGNIDIYREFNDVRDIVMMYMLLLKTPLHSEIVNLCSGKTYKIYDIIKTLNDITNIKMNIDINQKFIRTNEIPSLKGCPTKLNSIISYKCIYQLHETLDWMFVEREIL